MTGRPVVEMLGKLFGRLTVVGRSLVVPRNGQARWICSCSCGGSITVPGGWLRNGTTKSCGCFRRDRAGQLYRKHGKSKTVAYTMFYDARKRAIELGLPFTLDPEKIVVPATCPVLGIALTAKGPRDNRPSLDKIIPARGYTPENTRVISFRANRIKSDATAAELTAILRYVEAAA